MPSDSSQKKKSKKKRESKTKTNNTKVGVSTIKNSQSVDKEGVSKVKSANRHVSTDSLQGAAAAAAEEPPSIPLHSSGAHAMTASPRTTPNTPLRSSASAALKPPIVNNTASARAHRRSMLKTQKLNRQDQEDDGSDTDTRNQRDDDSTISALTNPTFLSGAANNNALAQPGAFALSPSQVRGVNDNHHQPEEAPRPSVGQCNITDSKQQLLHPVSELRHPDRGRTPAAPINGTVPITARLVEEGEDLEARLRREIDVKFQHIAEIAARQSLQSSSSGVTPASFPTSHQLATMLTVEQTQLESLRNPPFGINTSIASNESAEKKGSTSRRALMILAACILLILVIGAAVAVTLVVVNKSSSTGDERLSTDSESPTNSPEFVEVTLSPAAVVSDPGESTLSPSIIENIRDRLLELLIPVSGFPALTDPDSSQYKALNFIIRNAGSLAAAATPEEILQTYIIILFLHRHWR